MKHTEEKNAEDSKLAADIRHWRQSAIADWDAFDTLLTRVTRLEQAQARLQLELSEAQGKRCSRCGRGI